MPIVLLVLIAVYAALAVFAWLKLRDASAAKCYPVRAESLVLAGALLLHGAALFLPVLHDKVLILGFGYTMSVLVWLALLMYWLGSFVRSLRGLQLLLYPCAVLAMAAAAAFPGDMTAYRVPSLPLAVHIALSLLAYSLFGLAALLAAWVLMLHKRLRRRRFTPLMRFLPPLLSMEKLMFQGLWAGFALLTLSLLGGVVLAGGPVNFFSHKTVFSVCAWLIYGGLLLKHSMTAMRGRRAAVWTLAGFVSLFLAYSGSKFVAEVLLR